MIHVRNVIHKIYTGDFTQGNSIDISRITPITIYFIAEMHLSWEVLFYKFSLLSSIPIEPSKLGAYIVLGGFNGDVS